MALSVSASLNVAVRVKVDSYRNHGTKRCGLTVGCAVKHRTAKLKPNVFAQLISSCYDEVILLSLELVHRRNFGLGKSPLNFCLSTKAHASGACRRAGSPNSGFHEHRVLTTSLSKALDRNRTTSALPHATFTLCRLCLLAIVG